VIIAIDLFDLVDEKFKSLATNHSIIGTRSSYVLLALLVSAAMPMATSSAYVFRELVTFHNMDPSMEPWGHPLVTFNHARYSNYVHHGSTAHKIIYYNLPHLLRCPQTP